jgi:tetratricopeptide (TPR) repeat protein
MMSFLGRAPEARRAQGLPRLQRLLGGVFILLWLSGGECSRERVESLNAMNEGVVFAAQKRYLDAVTRLQQAAALDPTNDQAYWNLAIVHMEMQQFDAARDDLRRAIDIDGTRAGYHEKLGTVLVELDDLDAARQAFERAIEIEPNLFKAYFKLGQILERQDDAQGALQRYTEAVQHGPRFIEGYRALGRLYADLSYLGEAVQVLQAGLQVAIAGTEDEAELHHLLGTVYQQQRNYDGAVQEFQAALRIDPAMQDTLFSLGWTYSLQNNREEARRYLKRFIDGAAANVPEHYLKAARDRLGELEGP